MTASTSFPPITWPSSEDLYRDTTPQPSQSADLPEDAVPGTPWWSFSGSSGDLEAWPAPPQATHPGLPPVIYESPSAAPVQPNEGTRVRPDESHPSAIRLMLVQEHALAREGAQRLLSSAEDVVWVGGTDVASLASQAELHRPDVIVVLLAEQQVFLPPAAVQSNGARLLLVNSHESQESLARKGISGALPRHALAAEILAAVRTVAHGGTIFITPPAGESQAVDPPRPHPTPRERQVLVSVARGLTNAKIAEALGKSPRTVQFHLGNLFAKLGVHSRTQLLREARRHGWLNPDTLLNDDQ